MSKPLSAYLLAVQRLLTHLSESMGELDRPIPAILFGGAAVNFHTQYRTSHDVDIDFLMRRVFVDSTLSVSYSQDGHTYTVNIDSNYNPMFGPMQEDYLDRAIPFGQYCGHNLVVLVAAPVDLAISKLGRFAPHDQQDIKALIDLGLIDREQFRILAEDALSVYVGNKTPLQCNLNAAIKFFDAPPADAVQSIYKPK